ncbi:MAG TPA: hypothetical protein VK308_02970 [Pyrinomonadaceae bacterium]|nr:hypothetical protein [Pyrinomonadaceae bacterium]
MDDEKLEKTVEFTLNNQAQFTVDIQKLQESQKEGEKRVNVLERLCLNLYNASVEQKDAIGEQTKNINQLRADIRELREGQKETAERLNAVVLRAEKYFSGENGGSKKKEITDNRN